MQDIKVLKVDQTEYWREDIQQRVKRIFTVYLFNPKKMVHCCEFTPSYECIFLKHQVDHKDDISEEEIESIESEVRGTFEQDVAYYHCSGIDKLPEFKIGFFPEGMMGVSTIDGIDPENRYSIGGSENKNGVNSENYYIEGEKCDDDPWIEEALEYARGNCV